MPLILQGLAGLSFLAMVVCYILVLVRMFQEQQGVLAAVCIVLTLCTGIGPIIGYIFGWMRVGEWGIWHIMLIWTVCILAFIVLMVVSVAMGPPEPGPMPTY